MKNNVWLSDKTKLFLFALLSFLFFLLLYGLFLGLETFLGGGQAFLWFLIFAPMLFICYHLLIGAFCYRATEQALWTVLSQFSATLCADLVVIGVNVLSRRSRFGSETPWLWWFDLGILVCQPILCYCGIRILKFGQTIRNLRQSKADKPSSEEEES